MMATEPWRFDGEEDWELLDLDSFFQVPSDHEVTSKEGDESTSENEGVWRSDMESKEGDAVSTPESEGMWRTNPAVERDLRLLELPKKLCHSLLRGLGPVGESDWVQLSSRLHVKDTGARQARSRVSVRRRVFQVAT